MDTPETTGSDPVVTTGFVAEVEHEVEHAAEAVVAEVDALTAKITHGVQDFIDNHLRNSPVSRNTAAWNHFREGVPVLIAKIKHALEG